MRFLIYH